MADMRGTAIVCNDLCGCPSPCPGGVACKCTSGDIGGASVEHKQCSCGEHCGCNPCHCPQSSNIQGTGKASCKCGSGCTCVACGA